MRDAIAVAKAAVPDIKMGLAGDYHNKGARRCDRQLCLRPQQLPHGRGAGRTQRQGHDEPALHLLLAARAQPVQQQRPADGVLSPPSTPRPAVTTDTSTGRSRTGTIRRSPTRAGACSAPATPTFIYPDGRSSVRYERFAEGVQLSEKIRLRATPCRQPAIPPVSQPSPQPWRQSSATA